MTQENTLIAAATITAGLSVVNHIAQDISLGVKNAKAISHRAGDSALGFRPITDFIDEMAQEVMRIVKKISGEAISMSQLAVEQSHMDDTLTRYTQVCVAASDAPHIESLNKVVAKMHQHSQINQTKFLNSIYLLQNLLSDVITSVRSAQMISVTARTEASRAAGFTENLKVVADDLDYAATSIRRQVVESKQKLSEVTNQLLLKAS